MMTSHGVIKLMLLGGLGVGFFVSGDFFAAREAAQLLPEPAAQASPDPPRRSGDPASSRPLVPAGAVKAPHPDRQGEDEERQTAPVGSGPSSASEGTTTRIAGEGVDREEGAHAFAVAVLRMSAEADAIDRVWRAYGSGCQVSVGRTYDFGRGWFAVWDQAIESRGSAAECAEMLQWIVDHGETLRRDLTGALSEARRARVPEETVEGMLRWHSLEWRP